MPRIFLLIAAFALVAFAVSQQFLTPKTLQPFVQGCIQSGATKAQCECLGSYVHDRLTEQEIGAVMENRVAGASFQNKVESTIQSGTLACR